MQELALDGNPIFQLKGYLDFCLVTCPNLKHLDLRKVTPEMRDSGNGGLALKDGKKHDEGKDNGALSTDISPDK